MRHWTRCCVGLALGALLALQAEASNEEQCKAVTTCFKGDSKAAPCTISDGICPPCIVMNTKGCYEYTGGTTTCPFGTDCKPFYGSGTNSSTSTASSASNGGNYNGNGAVSSGGNGNGNGNSKSPKNSGSKHSGSKSVGTDSNANTSKSSGSGGSSFMVILAVAAGVLIVGGVFFFLVQRSRSRDDDDDDEMETPGLNKGAIPRTASNNSQYAPFPQAAKAQPTPTNHVLQYYQDNASMSPRSTGKAYGVQAQPLQPTKVVRPMPSANAQAFFPPSNMPEPNYAMPTHATGNGNYGGNMDPNGNYGAQPANYGAPPNSNSNYGAPMEAPPAMQERMPPPREEPSHQPMYQPEARRESKRESFEF